MCIIINPTFVLMLGFAWLEIELASKIIKEETNSTTTIQTYCCSEIIQKHWWIEGRQVMAAVFCQANLERVSLFLLSLSLGEEKLAFLAILCCMGLGYQQILPMCSYHKHFPIKKKNKKDGMTPVKLSQPVCVVTIDSRHFESSW